MIKFTATLISAAVLALSFLDTTFTWGKTGHRVTGDIAQERLSRKAQKEIKRILGVENLAQASTWADLMRSSQDDFWTKEAGPYHYVTIPPGKTYAEVGAPPEGDAISALAKFKAVLRNKDASREDKQLALRFTVHIIGDLHQPLHAGNGTDRGGNDFKMKFFWETTNLHRVWDDGLIKQEDLSYSEMSQWFKKDMTRETIKAWSETYPIVWATESAALRDKIYPEANAEETWDYLYAHRDTVQMRLSQGGVRIAAYLNEVFK